MFDKLHSSATTRWSLLHEQSGAGEHGIARLHRIKQYAVRRDRLRCPYQHGAISVDHSKRRTLIEFAKSERGYPESCSCPIVPMDLFFDGNDDLGSIGCNLLQHPGIEHFHAIFDALSNRADVTDIQVELNEIVESDETMWPFSERVYVSGNIDRADLNEILAPLRADDISIDNDPPSDLTLRDSDVAYSVWWD